MIRPHEDTSIAQGGMVSKVKRRQLLRIGFLTATLVGVGELLGVLPIFIKVIKIEGLGAKITAGKKSDILATFAKTKDEPILNTEGRFFLIHGPGAIAAAYRKCVHLGCAVPYSKGENQFHCPCHGSLYDKLTALKVGGPAPRGLDLFHISEVNGALVVNTNPLEVMKRAGNQWDPSQVEVPDA
ncbi:MAG TPA: Rieske 2Fe-2S domain-containing protein [Candidatus Limnocylindrales bacterium]|nr:Rieske 2Fe-2S domain-containing protein [Candidatus Limnocylindrales bacterium]